MRIGEILYFAPGIRFDKVDLNGTGLPRQFECRIAGFYLDAADRCAKGSFAFASGVILVSCIDALARLRFNGGVGARFTKLIINELRSFKSGGLADRFYDEFRNGPCTKLGSRMEVSSRYLPRSPSIRLEDCFW